ncbi:hypothetical protein Sru01_33710 [Sphaerisporangium rufum]|uniref:Uncharacterized protein n=1 Tax=Sphaerisporangium rufum TaxID=1381558 RepID=A0A919V043_9ACTN|nr:hypothetical protein [Sphaerisporangium rufum]GII78389.1 hypothetical protein Sru01_33710 [Sphaerisporangium rufum]
MSEQPSGGRPDLAGLRARVRRQVIMAGDRAFESPPRGGERPPRVVSDAEREGVPPTDTGARPPLGVGPSSSARAERTARRGEPGRRRHGRHGPAGRPHGTAEPGHGTGVGGGTVQGEGPYLPPGDQAG